MTQASSTPVISHHPAVDESRVAVDAPVVAVTLLEDRAQVQRRASLTLSPGRHRLAIWDVAPATQDVSVRASSTRSGVKIGDAKLRRAARVERHELPEVARSLEEKLEALTVRHRELRDDAERVQHRASVVAEMMQKALAELPEDAAWSIGDHATWKQTFETLSKKSRVLLADAQETRRQMVALQEDAHKLSAERRRIDQPSTRVLAIIELDVVVDEGASADPVDVVVEYTVPNAIWRPTHEATLREGRLQMTSKAAVWQHTGEDWNNVDLSFSTARSALGHEPPLLSDDVISTKKKDQRVVVQAREVAVSKAGLGRGGGGGGGGPSAVDLPGVDDGGDIQNLKAQTKVIVPSTGAPVFVPLATSVADAKVSLVIMAEAEEKAMLKAVSVHQGRAPLLAGPVELLRDSGPVGNTSTLFVAPGEQFALGFGPDDDIRVRRTTESKDQVDEVDRWRRRTVTVNLYLSNLGAEYKDVEIVERLPVSETEHVTVTLVADKTSGAPVLDEDGFLRWKMSIASRGRLRLSLVYVVAFAPGVSS